MASSSSPTRTSPRANKKDDDGTAPKAELVETADPERLRDASAGTVVPAEVVSAARAAFPGLDPGPPTVLAGGGASLVLRFADRIVRIPRHPFVAERFRVAAALCAAIRDRLPVAIPDARAGGPDRMECHAALPGRMPGRGDAGTSRFPGGPHAVPPATACRATSCRVLGRLPRSGPARTRRRTGRCRRAP
jgi:hypothetical protein